MIALKFFFWLIGFCICLGATCVFGLLTLVFAADGVYWAAIICGVLLCLSVGMLGELTAGKRRW